MGRYGLDAMARPLNTFADAVEPALFGRSTAFSWQVLVNGAAATPQQLTNLIAIWPVLDYAALEPGQAATDAVRQTAADAKLGSDYGATVRLTGSVPLADQQFATLREGVLLNALLTAAIVLIVLWLALRSIKIVVAAVLCIAVGLVVTAALGLLMVGAFNPISVAFAVLFVGLGADFAIQFSVRYRAQRHERGDLMASLTDAAFRVGAPLTLAAAAAAAGFLAFAPTSYRGVAQLGLIAGCGMVVAYLESITLLPALLWCFDPPGEPEPLGYSALAGADRFLQRHRMAIVITTSLVVLLGLPFLTRLEFNFDPNGLQKSSAEPIETLQRLRSDPRVAIIAAEVLTPAADAAATASKLAALPEVERVATLDSFVPDDGQAKLTLIASAATALDPALQAKPQAAPSDGDDIAALKSAAQDLRNTASESSGAGVDAARRLAKDLDALAGADASTRRKVATAFLTPLAIDLQQIARLLHPALVTPADLPDRLVRDWTTPDGLVRTEIVPKGDPDDSATLRRFAQAVLAVEPNATGQAIQIYEWGRTVMMAFVKAGALALLAISILLWLVLRRIGDVLLTLIPLLVAATATLEICAVTGFSLNYANIIALPALLGVGVAFKIYYVMAWRGGEANFLQSSLTRAVFFSAVMTATAFGSLWLSGNPGISSMGKLLSLSLACTLAAAALFQPALMGPPRVAKPAVPSQAEPSQV
jgi:hopanoid biosynthesis associated RND transporter like protein HpnN